MPKTEGLWFNPTGGAASFCRRLAGTWLWYGLVFTSYKRKRRNPLQFRNGEISSKTSEQGNHRSEIRVNGSNFDNASQQDCCTRTARKTEHRSVYVLDGFHDSSEVYRERETTVCHIRREPTCSHSPGASPEQWRHVRSEINPADYASRDIQPSETEKLERWKRGPEFLWQPIHQWPDSA